MKSFFLIILIFTNVFMLACSEKKRQPFKKIDYISFADSIFKDYGYNLNYGLNKEHSDIVDILISKKLTKDEYENQVKKRLIDRGWIQVSNNTKPQDVYCLNKATQLAFLNPENLDSNYDKKSHFVIYYNDYGVDGC